MGILDHPYAYIRTYGTTAIGVNDLPHSLFTKEYLCPVVNEENIWEKVQAAECLLQEHGIDISMNLYNLSENRVHTTLVKSEKTVTATRVITVLAKTSRPRQHISSFNLVLSEEGGEQFQCWNCLNTGKFMYHNIERFYYNRGPEELAKLLKVSIDSITSDTIDGETK